MDPDPSPEALDSLAEKLYNYCSTIAVGRTIATRLGEYKDAPEIVKTNWRTLAEAAYLYGAR